VKGGGGETALNGLGELPESRANTLIFAEDASKDRRRAEWAHFVGLAAFAIGQNLGKRAACRRNTGK
jgi:hypothetical protein